MSYRSAIRTWLLITLLPAALGNAADLAVRLETDIRTNTLQQSGKETTALRRDDALAALAREHSKTMHRLGTLGHEVRDGDGPAERLARHHRALFGLVSENLAVQKRWPRDMDLAESFVAGWMNSPGHRANIVAPYEIFEVGCFGDRDAMYCTQLFVRSPTRLTADVAFRQPPGKVLTLKPDPATTDRAVNRRISIEPAGLAPEGPGVAVENGSAPLRLPERAGLYQLKLWTQQDGDSSRYRIVGGPYVCITSSSATREPCHGRDR